MSTTNKDVARQLRQLQRHFQQHVLAGSNEIVTYVTDRQTASGEQGLTVYVEGYRARLTEALATDFFGLHALLGEKGFESMAHAYIAVHPSEHFSLRYLGSHLTEFFARTETYADRPFLREMAAFEWQLRSAFDAADADVCSVNDIEAIESPSWGHMRFDFHPSVKRLDLRWNVPAIWSAVESNRELPEPDAKDVPQPWLIWRQDLKTYFRSLAMDESVSLDALIAGQHFAQVCEQLCEWIEADSVATHAAHLLKRWVSDGLIASVSIGK